MPVDAEFLFDWIEASIRLATPLVLVAMGVSSPSGVGSSTSVWKG